MAAALLQNANLSLHLFVNRFSASFLTTYVIVLCRHLDDQ